MKKEDAEYHMDRCVKSGLWVPDAKAKAAAAAALADEEIEEAESNYDTVKTSSEATD